VAKAFCWAVADTEARQRGEQTGLDTLVVHAVNDDTRRRGERPLGAVANAVSVRLGSTAARLKLKGIERGPAQAVEHVV